MGADSRVGNRLEIRMSSCQIMARDSFIYPGVRDLSGLGLGLLGYQTTGKVGF